MATLQEVASQLQAAQNASKAYEDPALYQKTQQLTKNAFTPVMQNAARDIEQQQANFLPEFFKLGVTGMGSGTSAADLTPSQKLQMMGQGAGRLTGQMGYATSLMDALGGQQNQMAQNALGFLNTGQAAAENNYNKLFGMYQLLQQQDEAEKNRRFQAEQAALARRSSGGGGGGVLNIPDSSLAMLNGGQQQENPEQRLERIYNAVQAGTMQINPNSQLGAELMRYLKRTGRR